MPKFSVVIIAHNEGHQIGRTVESLLHLSDDIIVVDSGSTDDTASVSEALGAKVVQYTWEGYAANKNHGHQAAKHDWILSIDADEVVSDELLASIQNLNPQAETVYLLDRINNYCGTWVHHCGWYPDWKPRLFNKQHVRWQGDFVHETLAIPVHYHQQKLKGKLYHYSYVSEDDHLQRMEKYTALAAQELFKNGKRANFIKLWCSPVWRFLRTYFLKFGFLDGRVGWKISCLNMYQIYLKYRKLESLHEEAAP